MLKNLLNKLAKKVLNATESASNEVAITKDEKEIARRKALIEQQTGSKYYEQRKTEVKKTSGLDTYEEDTNVFNTAIQINNSKLQFNAMDWKELQRNNPELISAHLANLRETLFSGCVEDIFEYTEEEFRTELLQLYLLNLKISDGTYNPEVDNLDSLSRDDIKQAIFEISLEKYKERLLAKGFKDVEPSIKQYNMLKKNGVDITKVYTRKKATQLINGIMANMDTTVSEKQINTIEKMVKDLNLSAKDYVPTDRKNATEMIGQLIDIKKKQAYSEPSSEKQRETYANALKKNNMRLTPKRKAWAETASKGELSDEINKLFTKYNEEHPQASIGQVNYICSMIDTINLGRPFNDKIPYDKADMTANLTREKASEMIDSLSRDYLYIKTRLTCPSISREDIGAMTREQVRNMLNNITAENKTRNYTVDAETGDRVNVANKYAM